MSPTRHGLLELRRLRGLEQLELNDQRDVVRRVVRVRAPVGPRTAQLGAGSRPQVRRIVPNVVDGLHLIGINEVS